MTHLVVYFVADYFSLQCPKKEKWHVNLDDKLYY